MQEDIAANSTEKGRGTLAKRAWGARQSFTGPTGLVRIIIILVAVAVVLGVFGVISNTASEEVREGVLFDYPEEMIYKWDVVKWINERLDWVVINGDTFFSGIGAAVRWILVHLRDFLQWVPWWLVIGGIALVAWRVVSWRLATMTVVFLGIMTVFGMMDLAMETLAIMFTATLICVLFGVPTGILAAANRRVDGFLRPILDTMQTMPSFVYLIPALMLFGLGMVPAVMATTIYAIPPIIRLTNLGIRQVDVNVMEAARSFGTTRRQLLVKVQIPLAMPTILAGLNQTVMMALAMTVLATMVGAAGLGVEVLTGLGRINPGQGFIGGISIVFLAIILDRISQGFVKKPEVRAAT